MITRYKSGSLTLLICSILLFGTTVAHSATEDPVEVLSRFWEYQTDEVQEAIAVPHLDKYTAEQVTSWPRKKKRAYSMLLANSCTVEDVGNYYGLYRYSCLDGPLYMLSELSLGDPMILLFAKADDAKRVVGYLDRYVEFLKAESALEDGLPIGVSDIEFLLEIQYYLINAHPSPDGS